MVAWPIELPQSLSGNGDYTEGTEETVKRTTMDSGTIKTRQRFTRAVALITGSFDITSAQVDTFISFYQNTIKGGSLSFTAAFDRSNTTKTYKFKEEPSITHNGGNSFKLSIKVLRLP